VDQSGQRRQGQSGERLVVRDDGAKLGRREQALKGVLAARLLDRHEQGRMRPSGVEASRKVFAKG
jgi:hypothetical protein